jgi:glucuronoarabinoxylan endo-1,4-beta-xylanase
MGGTGAVTGGSSGTGGVAGGPGGAGSGGTSPPPVAGTTGAVTVRLDQAKQTMDGFGLTIAFERDALTDAEADSLFNTSNGIGLSIVRIFMASNGEPESGATPASAKKAIARGADRIVATAPSAFASCKTNKDEDDGGHLIANDGGQCYDQWSSRIAAFPAKVKSALGVDLHAMSFGNEPDYASCGTVKPCFGSFPSMLYTADEAVAFMKVVGPKLHAASPTLKVMAPEARQWARLWTNTSGTGSTDPLNGRGYDYGHALANDAVAWAQVDILAVHQYDTQVAQPWPSDVPRAKPIWQTEMSGLEYWPEAGPSVDIDNGVAVAGWIHDAIVNGPASAWIWYRYKSTFIDDNEGLLLQSGADTKRHYTIGNFSKFVRPGYTRVDVAGNIPADVLLTAYKAADGTVVVVAINKGSAPASLPIAIAGGAAPAALTPWVTAATDNLATKPAVPVSAGSFTAALGGKTVTTFVGR